MRRVLLPILALLAATSAAAVPEISGKNVFNHNCSHCHAPGREHPGTLQLGLTRGQDQAVLEERTDLTADYVRHVVRHGLKAKPPFVPSDLNDAQLRALSDYLTH